MITIIILLALVYAFLNGFRDSASILAGVIASRAMHPRRALFLVALAEFCAPFLFGAAVARTLATGLITPGDVNVEMIVAATAATLLWTVFAWLRGIPSSSSQALIGSLIGAALFSEGGGAIQISGLYGVVLPMFIAPPLGLLVGYLVMKFLLWIFASATPRVNSLFRRLQVLTMVGLALSHSANDSGKSIGIIMLGLVMMNKTDSFAVPLGVTTACAAAIGLGAVSGDWRLIRTLGGKIFPIRPINALASQSASAVVIMGAALAGAPVSTSQVISMALMGSGAAERVNKVRWQVGIEMLAIWGLTIPVNMLISALVLWLSSPEYPVRTALVRFITHLFSG